MSFQQGLSGLNATAKSLEVIGNNIANANTFGAKMARAEFSDVYASTLGSSADKNVGIGTELTAVAQQFTQGNISTTQNPMDLAINGSGFFRLSDGKSTDPVGSMTYSRNGQFKVDDFGTIVNNAGQRLVGYTVDATGKVMQGELTALRLPTEGMPAKETEKVSMGINLDSRRPLYTPPGAGPLIDYSDASTYHNATSVTLYDANSQEVAVTFYFQKTAANEWNVFGTADGVPLDGAGGPGTPLTNMQFSPDGATLITPTALVAFSVPANVNAQGIGTIGIGQAPSVLTADFSRTTQFGSAFGITDLRQDGFARGDLTSIAVEANGVVTARYSNGRSRAAGQIELVNFRNPQGLQPVGANGWISTITSGEPLPGIPGDGNIGALQAGALEESNVDLTAELVNMITAQRIYQANAQTIKTLDQLMQTLINIR